MKDNWAETVMEMAEIRAVATLVSMSRRLDGQAWEARMTGLINGWPAMTKMGEDWQKQADEYMAEARQRSKAHWEATRARLDAPPCVVEVIPERQNRSPTMVRVVVECLLIAVLVVMLLWARLDVFHMPIRALDAAMVWAGLAGVWFVNRGSVMGAAAQEDCR
jgi:hypothetical protein